MGSLLQAVTDRHCQGLLRLACSAEDDVCVPEKYRRRCRHHDCSTVRTSVFSWLFLVLLRVPYVQYRRNEVE